jgi:hypothetical protein
MTVDFFEENDFFDFPELIYQKALMNLLNGIKITNY